MFIKVCIAIIIACTLTLFWVLAMCTFSLMSEEEKETENEDQLAFCKKIHAKNSRQNNN